eukprot:m.107574 g.107574  ORF g.107574 m.107574 type:complete len:207 (-) comp12768_c0_seq1:127-747(-)
MFCTDCGNALQEGNKYCGSCGHPTAAATPPKYSPTKGTPAPPAAATAATPASWKRVLAIELCANGKSGGADVVHLRQVQAYDAAGTNVSLERRGAAVWQASTHHDDPRNAAKHLIDGDLGSSNHTAHGSDSTVRITLGAPADICRVVIHNKPDHPKYHHHARLHGTRMRLLGVDGSVIFQHTFLQAINQELFSSASNYTGEFRPTE